MRGFPEVPYPDLLGQTVKRFPEKQGILFHDQAYTFRELDQASNRAAHGLLRLGIRKGDRVLLSVYTRPEYLVYFYGILKIGAIVVPMNPSYKHADAKGILLDAEPKAAFVAFPTYDHLKSVFRASSVEHLLIQGEKAAEGCLAAEPFLMSFPDTPPDAPRINPEEDIAFLPYTSGTTGNPKGAMLTHRNLVACHWQYVCAGRISERDTSLIFLPATHVYGTMLMGGTVMAGATQVLVERYSLEASLELVQKHRVTIYYGTTSVFVEMANFACLNEYDLSSIRYFNSGGAPLSPELAERIRSLSGVKVANGYGMTEAPISGSHVPGEERRIADLESGVLLEKPGVVGEVIIRGPQVMKGYWRDPEATAQVLRDGWFYTGDIGVLDQRGDLTILGRKKEIIKYKGFAIAPSEIEGILLEHPAVADCAVIGVPHNGVGEVPKAFVVLKNGSPTPKEEILDFVASKVAGYKRVRELVFVDSLPRNPQGKILKRFLR